MNRMVTKDYRKGVYERVTKETGEAQFLPADLISQRGLVRTRYRMAAGRRRIFPRALREHHKKGKNNYDLDSHRISG